MSKFSAGRKVIYQCIEKLAHAKQCGDPYCTIPGCIHMKKHVDHYEKCCLGGTKGGCDACVQLESICVYHTRTCRNKSCGVPFCSTIKEKARKSQVSSETQRKSGSAKRRSASFSGTSQQPPEYQPSPPYERSASASKLEVSASKIEVATPIDGIQFGKVSMETLARSMPCNTVNTWGPDQQMASPPSIPPNAFSVAVSQEHDRFLREVLNLDYDAKELPKHELATDRDVCESVEVQEAQFYDEAFNDNLFPSSGDPLFRSTEPTYQMETLTHCGQVTMDVPNAAIDTANKSSDSQGLSPPSPLEYMIHYLQKIYENPVLRVAFENDYMKSRAKNSDLGVQPAQVRVGGTTTQPCVWGELEGQLQSTEDGNRSNLRQESDNNVLIQEYLIDPFSQL